MKLYSFKLSDSPSDIIPKIEVEVATLDHPLELASLQPSLIEQRIARGDKIFVACHKEKPIAYLFSATRKCRVSEIQDWIIVASGEVYLYDAFTMARYRGNRIYPFLLNKAIHFFKELAYSYALICTTSSNISSIKGVENAGFHCYETINFYNLFGLKFWNYKQRDNDVQSRFSNEI